MNRIFFATLIAAGAALAQDRGPNPGGFMRFQPVLSALDADHDSVISAAELANAPAVLMKLDKNSDGKLTMDELRPNFEAGGPGGPGGRRGPGGPGERGGDPEERLKALMAFDKNGDGKLSKDEVPERMQGIFARADADNDGLLTADEIRKAAPQGGPGPRGGSMRMDPISSALDADQDGVISAEEISKAGASLAKLDKNGDGKLTEDEVRPNFGPGRRPERQ